MGYRIYGKLKTAKRFAPFDAKENKFVVNLIYASMFNKEDFPALKREVQYMNEENPLYIFEIRPF